MFNKAILPSATALCLLAVPAPADQVIADDLIVIGETCIGNKCEDGEVFTNDTLRIKNGRVRIHLDTVPPLPTSPATDWRIVANDYTVNGREYFAIEDATAGVLPFTIEAGAPRNSIFVRDTGSVGLGTLVPTADLHIKSPWQPKIFFEQDTAGGFPAQSWLMRADHIGFNLFESVSNGKPFEIATGSIPGAFKIDGNRVGFGTANPDTSLHVLRTDGTAKLLIDEASTTTAARELMTLRNNGQVAFTLEDTSIAIGNNTGREWKVQNVGGEIRFTTAPGGPGERELQLDVDGNLSISGSFFSDGDELNVPDYVFGDDYALRPLAEVRDFINTNSHLPEVPSAADIAANGINHSEMQMTLLKKIEELTLYTLQLEARLEAQLAAQHAGDVSLRVEIDALRKTHP